MVKRCQELKCIYDGEQKVEDYGIEADYYYLQPCDVGDAGKNAEIIGQCIEEIKKNPKWMLSLQTHKLIGFK
jgi:organic radical activating enzyme